MTSIIELYQGVEFTETLNFVVDDIETYLTTIPAGQKQIISPANYVKHDLTIELCVDLSQTFLNLNGKYFNYCKITNIKDDSTREKSAYYFISALKWTSKSAIRLSLKMDTLNTIGVNLTFSNRTLIHRQHKNRWDIDGTLMYGVIDKISENLNVPLYRKSEVVLDNTFEKYNFKWYIVYLNSVSINPSEYNQVIPINYYIAPAHDIEILPSNDFNISLPMDSNIYTISPLFNNSNGLGTIGGKPVRIEKVSNVNVYGYTNLLDYPFAYYIISYVTIRGSSGQYTITPKILYTTKDFTVLHTITGTSAVISSVTAHNMPATINVFGIGDDPFATPLIVYRNNTNQTIRGIDTLNKTDEKLIKIIELPYCPLEINEIYNGVYSFNAPVFAGSQFDLIEIKGPNVDFLETNITIEKPPFLELGKLRKNLNTDLHWNDLKSIDNEPKMFHSEIFYKKFMYDSFERLFAFEDADIKANISKSSIYNRFSFKQVVSLALTSKFIFDLSNWEENYIKEDYPLLINSSRNNEVVIYNNQYLNYLRTGLQYDLKAKAVQDEANIVRTIIGGAGSVAAMAGSALTGNALGVVMGVTTLGNNVYSLLTDSTMRDQSLEAKRKQLAAQKTSVSGADDLGLLKYYSKGNWPKITTYQPSDHFKNKIFDIFFYTGYTCECLGTPDLTSRLRFNYVQAEIKFDTIANTFLTLNYSQDIITDYKQKWAQGITILHHNAGVWDFEQKFENWEAILENYLQ